MLTWFAQEQPTSCVAACVRMVLTGFGVVWTEQQIHIGAGMHLHHKGPLHGQGPLVCTRWGHQSFLVW